MRAAALSRPATIAAWQGYLGAACAATLAYSFLPSGARIPVFSAVAVSAVLAVAVGTARTRPRSIPWWLIAAALASWTLGGALYIWIVDRRFPSVADGFFLATFPLVIAGVAGLVHERGRLVRGTLLDAAIVTVPLALALWVAFIDPLATDAGRSAIARVVGSAYPVGDAALLALVLVLALRPLSRVPAYWLLLGALLALVASDLAFDERLTYGRYVVGSWVDCGWMLMYALFAAAALHPSARSLGVEVRSRRYDALGVSRLALLAAAPVAASAVVVVAFALDRDGLPVVEVVATLVPLLILARLGKLVAEHRRAATRAFYLAGLVDSTQDAIVATDLDGTIRTWNEAAERTLGFTAEETIGRKVWEFGAATRGHESRAILDRIARGERVEHFQTVRRRRDGTEFAVSLTVSPIRDLDGVVRGASGILRDVSEQKRLEEQLRGAQRMEAVGQLAGGIAHDFNNMLTAVLGHAGLLAEELEKGDARRTHVDQINEAAGRAAQLTRQLLAFGRRQTLREAPIDLNLVVRHVRERPAEQEPAGVEVVLDLAAELGTVKADADQLERVLDGLLENAHEAMPHGGSITITTRNTDLDEAFVAQHPGSRTGPYVELAVADTGKGMASAVADRVFEPFFSTKPATGGPGAGLGLSTVYGIVKQSNGYVSVHSTEGAGTVFRVFLPRTDDAPAPPAEPSPVPAGRATVLLVEDEQIVRELVTEMLRHVGYDVIAADRPERALELAAAGAEFDLVVTDLVMPGMHGRQLAERLKELRPGLPVLFISGYSGGLEQAEGGVGEADPFLAKPFSIDELAQAVRGLLARSRPK